MWIDAMARINSIFVYGTLQPGKQNEHVLRKLNGTWRKGYVIGLLINEGWGTKHGCPGLKLHKDGSRINGMIFQSIELNQILCELDDFEGEEYKRIVAEIHLENHTKTEAYLYELAT